MLRKEINKKLLDYFHQKLMLIEDNDLIEQAELMSDDTDIEEDIYAEAMMSHFVSKDHTAIDNANQLLSLFPIDKTQYSSPELSTREANIFAEKQDIDQSLNAILFSTRLLYLDVTPIKSKEIFDTIATDSYSYMNELRKAQLEVLKEEIIRVQNLLKITERDTYKKLIRKLTKLRVGRRDGDAQYRDAMIDFYATYVLNPDIPFSEREEMIKNWIDKKIEFELS